MRPQWFFVVPGFLVVGLFVGGVVLFVVVQSGDVSDLVSADAALPILHPENAETT